MGGAGHIPEAQGHCACLRLRLIGNKRNCAHITHTRTHTHTTHCQASKHLVTYNLQARDRPALGHTHRKYQKQKDAKDIEKRPSGKAAPTLHTIYFYRKFNLVVPWW